jgi:hypothetical protein
LGEWTSVIGCAEFTLGTLFWLKPLVVDNASSND